VLDASDDGMPFIGDSIDYVPSPQGAYRDRLALRTVGLRMPNAVTALAVSCVWGVPSSSSRLSESPPEA